MTMQADKRVSGARTIALIVAAGRGERAGGGVPKQYVRVAGSSVLAHAVDAFRGHAGVADMVVVIGAGQQEAATAAMDGRAVPNFVEGGASRRESVLKGLEWIAANGGARRVLIHDAARPFLPASVIDSLLAALDDAPGAVPVLPVADTLVAMVDGVGAVVDRSALLRVQTPQAFAFDVILAAHRAWPSEREATDDVQIARAAGHRVLPVEGDSMLDKLTWPADFALAEARMAGARSTRIGMGYDVHKLVGGEELWLGGVKIDHVLGLSGHSDADVALHALVDAMLGALAEGDIGSHFPPSDPQWRGARSQRFVEYARDRVRVRGGRIEHVDLTIVCEAPRIGPHREAMRMAIAAMLDVAIDRVSVKATTTERLGFAGRGEGIAAHAVATLSLPDRVAS